MRRVVLAAIAVAWLGTGCGEDVCGPGDIPIDGITGAMPGVAVSYGGFTSSPNNDCSVPGAPTSLTVDGVQAAPASAIPMHLTLCLPRPDELGSAAVPLDDTDRVQLIDVFAEIEDGCVLALDRTRDASGTMEVRGYCDGGLDRRGYALALDASVPMRNTCTDEPVAEPMVLSGAASVTAL